jgi:hypothetical protein
MFPCTRLPFLNLDNIVTYIFPKVKYVLVISGEKKKLTFLYSDGSF